MAVIAAPDLRAGMTVRLEGELYKVISADYHAGGGKMPGVTHAKLRNRLTGAVRERRFRPEERLEAVEIERQAMQFLYADDEQCYFMNPESFEQIGVPNERLGPVARYLQPELTIPVEFSDGQPVGAVFPDIVEVRVATTAPPVHGAGSDNVWKEAELENGLTIMVPPFIAAGEMIRVEVETGKYVDRARTEREKKK
ncbi:MAG TPA: elongation factor P [Candidatus Xenobia bacterium]|nr:elongation factor P [Candidatus Xenobia bacterium]